MKYVIIEDEDRNAALLANYVQQLLPDAVHVVTLPSVQKSVAWF